MSAGGTEEASAWGGRFNHATVGQTGSANGAGVFQMGPENLAGIGQAGPWNRAILKQWP
jgi:hypothetical protein